MKDPHLIIYHPVREAGYGLIVTNGDQTDTIWEYLNFMDALNSWQLVKELKEATGMRLFHH